MVETRLRVESVHIKKISELCKSPYHLAAKNMTGLQVKMQGAFQNGDHSISEHKYSNDISEQ